MTAANEPDRDTALELFGAAGQRVEQYVSILASKGIRWGLLGPREVGRLWGRHILNSVALSGLIPEGSAVVDVGSGAGLPGIPLAILRPDLSITLLEPLLRRVTFLGETVEDLGLGDRVDIVRGRAEDQSLVVDTIVCRAVAPLDRLLGWTSPLLVPDGQLLALKGSSAADEVAAAERFLRKHWLSAEVLTARAHPNAEITQVVRVRRV